MLNVLNLYLLDKEKSGIMKFLEGLKEDLLDVIEDFGDFFMDIKDIVYGGLVDKVGETPVNLLLIGGAFLIIMLVCLKIINH